MAVGSGAGRFLAKMYLTKTSWMVSCLTRYCQRRAVLATPFWPRLWGQLNTYLLSELLTLYDLNYFLKTR